MSYKINKFEKNRSYKNFPKVVKLHRTLKKERQESFRKDIGCLRNIRCLKPLLFFASHCFALVRHRMFLKHPMSEALVAFCSTPLYNPKSISTFSPFIQMLSTWLTPK